MSAEIKLRADEARSHADDVRKTKEEAQQLMDSLRNRIDGLVDSFTGRTHDKFIERIDEWKASNDEMNEALYNLGQFLETAANTIEQVDTDLASQLG